MRLLSAAPVSAVCSEREREKQNDIEPLSYIEMNSLFYNSTELKNIIVKKTLNKVFKATTAET